MRFLAAAGAVMVAAGLAGYTVIGELGVPSGVNLVGGALLLALAAGGEVRRFRGFAGSRPRRVALRWSAGFAAVVVAVVGANVAAQRLHATLDLTAQRRYTLSDQTRELCLALRSDVGAPRPELLLFEDALLADDARLLLAAYRAACPVTTRELASSDAPPSASAIVESYDTAVVACRAGHCDYVGYPSEENITNALLRLIRPERPRVYFTVGHGEVDLESERAPGFAALAQALRDEGIELLAFAGAAHDAVPEDASALVAAAPDRDLLDAELEALDRHLGEGGRLLVLLEPGAHSNLAGLLRAWGFDLPETVLADHQSSPLLEDPPVVSLVVNRFAGDHPITRKMNARTMALMPGARPVLFARKPQRQDRLVPLVFASPRSWAETDLTAALAGRDVEPDSDELAGVEIPLAAAGRYPRGEGAEAREARIVVIGDRDFASNRWLRSLYNRDLILNSILWLAEQEDRVALRPKSWTPDSHPLALETALSYFYSLGLVLPELLALLGIRAWYRQRR